MSGTRVVLAAMLARSLKRRSSAASESDAAQAWIDGARAEITGGVTPTRFAQWIALASRNVPRGALEPTGEEIVAAFDVLEGWNPERWTLLEAARVLLVLALGDSGRSNLVETLEDVFRYADVGELCALYRSLAHLPDPQRFAWRAGEGCRTSMRAVFEAAACDTPYPVLYFDEGAWRQLVIKCLFVEAPLWRVYGLDTRIDAELARMALDLADERRSAGRPVQHELWVCLGRAAGERGRASLERELAGTHTLGRKAAAIALARAGELTHLSELCDQEKDASVAETMRLALKGHFHQRAFRDLDASAPRNATPPSFLRTDSTAANKR